MGQMLRTTQTIIAQSKQSSLHLFTKNARNLMASRLTWQDAWGPLLAVILAVGLWLVSLRQVDLSHMTDIGLISVLPALTYVAIIILTISFGLLVHRRQARSPILLLHVIALIFIIHGTPNLLYHTLRFAWAWKHVGIVDYIQRHNRVEPDIIYLNAYHNWPGFFALNALFTEVAGFKNALSYAGWGPVFFNLLDLGALLLIYKTGTADQRLVWLSVWLFFLANWIGQDYFSPQAMTYFFYLVIVGIVLRWFNVMVPPSRAVLKRWLVSGWLAVRVHALVGYRSLPQVSTSPTQPVQRMGLTAMIVILFMAVASSHQLTPFMVIGALLLLVIFQRCQARSLPILLAVLAGVWISFMAVEFMKHGNIVWAIQSVGRLFANFNANFIDLSQASQGQRWVAMMSRGLSFFVGSLAVWGGFRRLRLGYWDLSFILLVIAPAPLLTGNSYGGEMVFRIYYFALPFMAFFAASVAYPTISAGLSIRTVALTVLLSLILLTGFSFAYFGKERMFYFSQDEVAASQYLYDVAPPDSLIVDGTVNFPWSFKNYEYFTYTSLVDLTKPEVAELRQDPVGMITDLMQNGTYTAAYLIFTRSQQANIEMLGLLPPGTIAKIEAGLRQSPKFKEIYTNQDAQIFILADQLKGTR